MNQDQACQIMGQNFFGIKEAIKYYGIDPTPEQLDTLSEVPFSKETLRECKNTHVLVAIFPISILDIRDKVQDKKLFRDRDWYYTQSFAKESGETGWQLICKTRVVDSKSKNLEEQNFLLSKDEEDPTAQVMVYTIIGHYLATGKRLFKEILVRTSSVSDRPQNRLDRVYVGIFDSDGLTVYCC